MSVGGPLSYNLSFTAASLRPELARVIAETFLDAGDWGATRDRVLATNALQTRSAASGIRLERELRQRLQTLNEAQLTLLARSNADDRSAMAWLAMLKYNALAFEFAAEVLRDKLAAHDAALRLSDYERFVESKAVGHPELTAVAETTRMKVRRVLLRMLAEVGILGDGPSLGTVQRPVLAPDVVQAIRDDDARWLAGFLVPDEEIART